MKHVQQTTKVNCGSACLAMVLDTTIEDIEQNWLCRVPGELVDDRLQEEHPEIPDEYGGMIGVSSYEICCILWDASLRHLYLQVPTLKDDNTWYDRCHDQLPSVRSIERVNTHIFTEALPAILGVESLVTKGGQHWIAMSGGIPFDPQRGRQTSENIYRNGCALPVHEAVLIMPTGDDK